MTFKRLPNGLGPLLPVEYAGKPIDFEDPDEDAVFGAARSRTSPGRAMLDFATCTECGRCQSQCPAWNTGKPLSPKLVIMDLRDHCSRRRRTSSVKRPRPMEGLDLETAPQKRAITFPSRGSVGSPARGPSRRFARSSAPRSRAA